MNKVYKVNVEFELASSLPHSSQEDMEKIVKKWFDNIWDDEKTPRVIVHYKIKP